MNFSIAKDFCRFPAGRVKADGRYSGQHLRELVVPLLQAGAPKIRRSSPRC